MKRILLLLSLFFVIACEKEGKDLIFGTWALVDYTVIDTKTGKEVSGGTDVKTWMFNDAGSAYVNGGTPLTYKINGDHLTITYVNTGNTVKYDIEELTKSTLRVYWHSSWYDNWYKFSRMKE